MTPSPFGSSLRKDFFLEEGYTPLNHGSYGTYPRCVRPVLRHYQEMSELFPDRWNRFDMYPELRKSRELLGNFFHCDTDEIVFSPNASTAANTILRSFPFEQGDKVLYVSASMDATYTHTHTYHDFVTLVCHCLCECEQHFTVCS